MARKLLSARDGARMLGLRMDSMYALIWAGKIPAEKKDGRWQISWSVIEKRKQSHK
jgi:hypothetical protein